MTDQDKVKRYLEELRKSLNSRNAKRCTEYIELVSEYFDGAISNAEKDYAIELVLEYNDQKINVLRFLAKSVHFMKKDGFDACNKSIFELIQKIVKQHPKNTRKHIKNIVNACTIFLQLSNPCAREKELAIQTVHQAFVSGAFADDVDIEQLIADIMSVLNQKKPTARLEANTFELLGFISEKYPEKFVNNIGDKLRFKMLTTIQALFTDDKADISMSRISGAINGLKSLLINFLPFEEEDPLFPTNLYECMFQLSNPDKCTTTSDQSRVPFRNMLHLIHQHGHIVSDYFFKDYHEWHTTLKKWISQKAYDDKNAGIMAMQTFHASIAKVLEDRKNPEDRKVLLFFMRYFKETLEAATSEPHEIRISIKGFGSMAAACRILLEPKYLCELFDLVMQRTEYSYHTKDSMKRREVLEHLPNYVESLSKIMNQLDEISGIQLQSLESIIVILIKDFHFLSTIHHTLVATSIMETFLNLQKLGGKVLEKVLESVIWQGCLWTCSHQLVYDLQKNFENIKDWKDTFTYRKFLPLWKRLLAPTDLKFQEISKILYSHFIRDLFIIIGKLDLSTRKRQFHDEANNTDKEFFFSDPSLDLEPVRAENFQILYNLVQFYGDMFQSQSVDFLRENFIEWLELWLEKTIRLSLKHPLISGFLRFVEIALKVIDRLDYANEASLNKKIKIIDPLRYYIKSILLTRCQQSSGELQIASIELVIQAPTIILQDFAIELVPIFKAAFNIGKNLMTLAHRTLTCYERIIDSLSNEPKARRTLLKEVLPCLETFLSSRDSTVEVKTLKRGKGQRRRLVNESTETELASFKKRILLFLGYFDPEEAQLILSKCDQKLVRDHITEIFQMKLECDDPLAPIIFLDQIIGRVMHLASSSSDRATKISACEMLHGLVLYMMGRDLVHSETLSLWKEMCKTLVILGCEEDETIHRLFEPLLMQMMHYYSQHQKITSPFATVLVEVLMETISYHGNSGIQDLSARLLREFILWLMKQTNRQQRQASPIKLVDLFYELRKMSIEANQSRRTGAVLAFNNIYRIVREEETLINVYWIYLLDVFAANYRITEDFSDGLENQFADERRFEQIDATMDHLTRVFIERSDIFHRSNTLRIKPAGFDGITLLDTAKWLLNQCGARQYHYRHKCMEMFIKILPECCTKEEFYKEHFSMAKIVDITEAEGIGKYPDLQYLRNCHEPIFKETCIWFQSVLMSLDFYIWIFENEIIPNSEKTVFLQQSKMLVTLDYYLGRVNLNNEDLLKSITDDISSSQISMETIMCNRNAEKIEAVRCLMLVRVIDFLTIMLKDGALDEFIITKSDILMKIIKQMIFKPQRLSFDFKSKNNLLELPKRMSNFLLAVNHHAPVSFRLELFSLLQKKLIKHLYSLRQHSEVLLRETSIDILYINKLNGIRLLFDNVKELLIADTEAKKEIQISAEAILRRIFISVAEKQAENFRPRHFSPGTKKFASIVMRLCLDIDDFLAKIIKFTFVPDLLKVTETCTIRHGEHFLHTFKEPIFEFFSSRILKTIELFVHEIERADNTERLRIFSILTELNEYIYKNRNQNHQLLEQNTNTMISEWPKIIHAAQEMDNNLNCVDLALIDLVTHMAMTCPIELHDLGQRLFKFQDWLLALIEKRENSLELKSKAIFLLPIITHRGDNNERLLKALHEIQQRHLPIKSKEFPEESLERAGLVAVSNSLFQSLLTSHSPSIYRFIIDATVADDDYILESKLQDVLVEYMEGLTPAEQENAINQTFEVFMNERLDPLIRLGVVSRFLLTIIKNAHIETILSFMHQKLNQILSFTEYKLGIDGPPFTQQHCFAVRCGGFLIIEAFIASVPRDKIESSTFNFGNKIDSGGTLVKELIKKAHSAKTEFYNLTDPTVMELFRKFQCYCYRALIALVSNCVGDRKDPKIELFATTLFKEVPVKNSFIWRRIVNVSNNEIYSNWTQDFKEFPKVKSYIISIKELRTNNETQDVKRNYIETVSIFDRSLSQSLTKVDLTNSVVLSRNEALEREQQRYELKHQKTLSVNLETMSINDHEVMPALVGVVNHLFLNKITPFLNLDTVDSKKIEWVRSIADALKDNTQHRNVRIFLTKLVDNCRDHFVYFAKILLGPILSVLSDRCAGNQMNFFVTDTLTMLLAWSHVYKPTTLEEKDYAKQLLKFLMENAFHEENEIFKLNLELIKKMVETWRDILQSNIPADTLLSLLDRHLEDTNEKRIRSGIQLNAVMLANDILPWNNPMSRDCFIKAILRCFDCDKAQIYQSASQLIGMCLNVLTAGNPVIDGDENDSILQQIIQKLDKIQRKDGRDANVFLQLLYGIQKSYPAILDRYIMQIQFNIPRAVRKIKCIYLEMFLARLELYKDTIFREIMSIGIKDILKQNEYQLLGLHIVNKALEYLTADETMQLYDELFALMSSPRNEIRNLLVEMMIFVIDKFHANATFDRKKPMRIILKGFTDSDQQIQNRVTNFFSDGGHLSKSFSARFLRLLSDHYDPSLEKEFLHYSTQLLLEVSIRHPRSKEKLLAYEPRDDMNFFEYPIATKSNSQRSLPPMFINSQQKQLLAGDGSLYEHLIRATQIGNERQAFTPTQDPIKMTQVPQTFAFQETQNSLFFSLKPQYLDRRSKICSQKDDTYEDDIEAQIARNKETLKPDSLDHLRRRIVMSNKGKISKKFALHAIERRDFQEAKQAERIKQSQQGKEVVLYRRYRLGDFPDFFFTGLAILLPLQALVKKDDSIARNIFISIFQSLIASLSTDETVTDDDKKAFFDSINSSVMFILQHTKNSDPFMLGTLIEMAMESEKYLKIAPELVANIAATNNMMITGALFLESQINYLILGIENNETSEAGPSAKRFKTDDADRQVKHWLKLTELYYKLNEYEVINGIFTEKLNLLPEVKNDLSDAINFEANGKFVDARTIYQRLIVNDAARNQNEKEFYFQSYFNCLASLSDWRVIAAEVQQQLNSYEEVWNDEIPFHRETFLPHLLKGELRMMLNKDVDDGFIAELERWMNDEQKCEYLRVTFPEEITMLHILDEKYAEGCVEAESALRNLGYEWSCLSMIDEKSRLLKNARNVAELMNFSQLKVDPDPQKKIQKLYQSWKLAHPKSSDSLVHWSDLLAYRKNFHLLIDKNDSGVSYSYLLDIERHMLDVAFAQNNCEAAQFILSDLHDELKSHFDNGKMIKCNLAEGKYILMDAAHNTPDIDDEMMKLFKAWKKLKKNIIDSEIARPFLDSIVESLCCTSEISEKFYEIYAMAGDAIPEEYSRNFMTLLKPVEDEELSMMHRFSRQSRIDLTDARHLAQALLDHDSSAENEALLAKIYLKLGQYYHKIESSSSDVLAEVQTEMIKSIFRAIEHNSSEAKVYIPYILQLSELKNNNLTSVLNEQLLMIPEWIFLPYISQLLSNFDFENECYLDNLLLRLAEKYPNALYFPFKLSRDHYRQKTENRGMEKEHVSRIDDVIRNPMMEKFMMALECLVWPAKLLQIHYHHFMISIRGHGESMTNEKFYDDVKKLHRDVFIKNREMKGSDFMKIKPFEKRIQEMLQMKWVNNSSAVKERIQKLCDEITNAVGRPKTAELYRLCNWMAEYKWCGERDLIEIPGQYLGYTKPHAANHVKIVRFEHDLKFFDSKQLPLKLKIQGSDGRTYSYIIKYGEDLRQDQRIQQVLGLMSHELAMDRNCKQNKLKIETYHVIPINCNCGILSVIENATTIMDYLQTTSKQFMEPTFEEALTSVRLEYRNYLSAYNTRDWKEIYEKAVKRNRQQLLEEYRDKVKRLPQDIIKKALMTSALSLETFYILRRNFATSLACMSIAHWLIAIGDRHLNNIMINLKTGHLIGIDFGIAFGAAASLKVPEIVPIRLTPHFVNILEPLGINGLIRNNMIHTLKCLRNYSNTILVCLDMFVKEPTMDWLQKSKMKSVGNAGNDSEGSLKSDWDPEARVAMVQRKLDGANPARITRDEITICQNSMNAHFLESYKILAEGAPDCVRAKMESDGLSVEQQVDALIDMATDENILALTYLGWDPYF